VVESLQFAHHGFGAGVVRGLALFVGRGEAPWADPSAPAPG
jgi:hypothetical protein